MAIYDYSFTTLDPVKGQVRTFRITVDSRHVALAEIRRAVVKVNQERAAAGEHRALPIPTTTDLDAAAPRSCAAPSLRVALHV